MNKPNTRIETGDWTQLEAAGLLQIGPGEVNRLLTAWLATLQG
ncbi:hypothetical protein [Streptomyces sp. NRRL S-813]|nr:hypothetical protein [Streptomyces sp. NRRL S-813]